MNYLHAKYAGNFADVFKHILHSALLGYLKHQPVTYIDTHAGAGLYSITPAAHAKHGVFRLLQHNLTAQKSIENVDSQPLKLINNYLNLIQQLNIQSSSNSNSDDNLIYPGSPWFAQQQLKQNSKLYLFDTNPAICDALKVNLNAESNIQIINTDGFSNSLELVNSDVNRDVNRDVKNTSKQYYLIDPPYKETQDYLQSAELISKITQANPQTIIGLWYPLINPTDTQQILNQIKQNVDSLELKVAMNCFQIKPNFQKQLGSNMQGCGMCFINLPDELMEAFEGVATLLHEVL